MKMRLRFLANQNKKNNSQILIKFNSTLGHKLTAILKFISYKVRMPYRLLTLEIMNGSKLYIFTSKDWIFPAASNLVQGVFHQLGQSEDSKIRKKNNVKLPSILREFRYTGKLNLWSKYSVYEIEIGYKNK